jgi:ubiquinone/menaquinone biosynthesis C-methylase UbiE
LNSGSIVKVGTMTISTAPPGGDALVPNHHADHPGFAGLGGLVAAWTFTIGRRGDAALAVRLTGLAPGEVVVDVGCGPGVAVRHAAAAGAGSVTGVDPATVMLRVGAVVGAVRPSQRRRVRYVAGTAEALPLDDGHADVVWSLATVHHWRDLERGLAEVRRVLRPGGRFLAVERRSAPGATGHASHGWTDGQAAAFADCCRAAGFRDVTVATHASDPRRRVLTVLAR